ncbi:MAG: IclR family transcriptional regulator [Burkholderiaceae bacterium]
MQSTQPEDNANRSLTRAIRLLDSLLSKGKPATLNELTLALELPKPTVYRLLSALTDLNLLERDPVSRRYGIGHSLLEMGQRITQQAWPSTQRRALMQDLVNDLGETCNFVVRVGNEVIWLERIETNDPVRLHMDRGTHAPLYCTASGKLFLSYLSESEIEQILQQNPIESYTKKTLRSKASLYADLSRIRQTRISFDRGEFLSDSFAVAVPIEGKDGFIVAALSAHGPAYRFSEERVRRFIPKLKACARRLSLGAAG